MHLVAGPSSFGFAQELQREMRLPLACADLQIFPDGESCCRVTIPQGEKVILIVQGTHPPQDRNLQQLFQLVDVAAANGASEIVCIVPYLAYARQDNR